MIHFDYKSTTLDARDFSKDPPAELDVQSVMRMRRMIADAEANGDRDWPYGVWHVGRTAWIPVP